MVFQITKIDSEGRKRYLSRAGHFTLDQRFAWSFTSYGDVVRANSRFRQTVETLPERRKAVRAGIVDLSALALLAGCSAMAYAIFATVSSFGTFLQF